MFKRSDSSQKTEDILAQIKSKISNQNANSDNVAKSDELDDLLLSELSADDNSGHPSENKVSDINLVQNEEFLEDEAALIESNLDSQDDLESNLEDLSSDLDSDEKDVNQKNYQEEKNEKLSNVLNYTDQDISSKDDDNDNVEYQEEPEFQSNYEDLSQNQKNSKINISNKIKNDTIANSINKLHKIIETRKEVKKNFGDLTMNDIVASIVKEKITEYVENFLEEQLPTIVNNIVEKEIKKIIDESKAIS